MFVQLVLSLTILSSLLVASVSGNTGFISQYTIDSASDANYLIFYGDSYTRVGFKLESDKPSKTDPIGNPEYPGVTTSGGINWADLLTTEFNQTTTLTYDFAIGGATINGTLIPPPGVSVDFYNQVKGSMTYLTRRRAIPWAGHKSVVLIWFGQNDVFQASTVRNDSNSIFNDAFTDYFNNVETVYRAGARNFLFVKVAREWIVISSWRILLTRRASDRENAACSTELHES